MADTWIADDLPSERYRLYSRANAGEVMPDPVSPLSASYLFGTNAPCEMGWRDAYVEYGSMTYDEFEADRPNTVAVFGGYFFLNMSATRIFGVRMPGMTPEMVDLQYFGDMPGITPYADEARPTDVNPERSAQMGVYFAGALAKVDLPDLRADRESVDRLAARRPDLSELTEQELVDHARSFMPLQRRLFCRHIIVSTLAGFGLSMVSGVCGAIGRPELAMTLVAGVGDVDSAAPSWALWELGRIARRSPSVTKAFDSGPPGTIARLDELAVAGDENAAAFVARWHRFLHLFGARGLNEWELRSRVWGVDPASALAAVDRMRFADDIESPQERTERRVAEREEATAFVRTALDGDAEALGTFEAGLNAALLYNAGRERTKTNCIKAVHEVRLAVRELGRRMVAAGHLATIEQVFMLVDRELDAFVRDPAAFSDLVAEREAYYLALFDRVPPFVTDGAPPPVSEWPRKGGAVAASVPGTVLTGIAGCPGKVIGRARVVLDPGDPRGLEPGEVLVAPFTDPSWTPLFVTAAAVVVDVGAQITHAVIVSRELGLPCVVSVTGASRSIPDGALVEVDGSAGTVTVLELPA